MARHLGDANLLSEPMDKVPDATCCPEGTMYQMAKIKKHTLPHF